MFVNAKGIENIAWLADPNPPWYWLVIVTARLWLQSGFYMILFHIPGELYEPAAIGGTSRAGRPSGTSPCPSCAPPPRR